MPPGDSDVAYLWDMRTTAREALSCVARVPALIDLLEKQLEQGARP